MTDHIDPMPNSTDNHSFPETSNEGNFDGYPIGESVEEPQRYTVRELLKDIVETILLAVVIYVVVNFISARYIVIGFSMEPTLHSGEYLIVDKMTYRFSEPQRGDVIVFDYPLHTEDDYVKRIIGLPGDEITINNGEVTINGEKLTEPYTLTDTTGSQTWHVSEDSYFVMGDNRRGSSDSRSWGELNQQHIIGRVWVIYWPIMDVGIIEHARYSG